jgi:hypothetical protein
MTTRQPLTEAEKAYLAGAARGWRDLPQPGARITLCVRNRA